MTLVTWLIRTQSDTLGTKLYAFVGFYTTLIKHLGTEFCSMYVSYCVECHNSKYNTLLCGMEVNK